MTRTLLALLAIVAVAALATPDPSPPAADPPPPGSFTIAVLPDTQNYAQSFPATFSAQTQWIADQAAAHDIRFALHLGDVTDDNVAAQWDVALTAMSKLDGVVPYAIAPGNHDYGPGGGAGDRTTQFVAPGYFGPGSPYATQPTVGGFFEAGRTDNSWHTFQAQGRDWIVLALEFGPRDDVVAWADQVLDAHPDHVGIVITHAYMYFEETRYDWGLTGSGQSWNPHAYGVAGQPGGVHDGWELWDALVREHDVALVLSGHVLGDGTGRQASVRDDGGVTHQVLSNFQSGVAGSQNGGDGYLRLLEFQPDGETLRVRSWSPVTGQYKLEADQEFTLGLFHDPVPDAHDAAVVREDPPLYWRLEQEPGPGVANAGTAAGLLTGTYAGPGPTAAAFDGSAAQVESAGPLAPLPSWSVAAWARTETTADQVVLTNDRDGWNDDVLLGLSPDVGGASTPGRWAVVHEDDDAQVVTLVESVAAAVPGRWVHLVASCDGATLRLYVDGELAGEAPAAGADLDWGGGPVRAGRGYTAGGGAPFDGVIGEVALFDRALTATDVSELRLAAEARVVAGLVRMTGPTDPGDNGDPGAVVEHSAFPGLEVGENNEGDCELYSAGRGLNARDGVLLATTAQNERDGLRATVSVARSAFGDGDLTASITQAAFAPDGAGTNEVNFDVGYAWFPYRGGWTAAQVDGDGTLFSANGVAQAMVQPGAPGRHVLDLGVDSELDGLLFAVAGNNEDNIVRTAPLPGGGGWDVLVQDNAHDFQTLGGSGEADPWAFVYVPLDTPGLAGGRYSGHLDAHHTAAGDFSLVRNGVGDYTLTIPGESPDTGTLLLTVSYLPTSGGLTAPDDNVLSFEDDGLGGFRVRSFDLPALAAQDTELVWAFVGWPDREPDALTADVDELSLASGGAQTFALDAGVQDAGATYLLLGSLSGASPGVPVEGLVLPLNIDAYWLHTLAAPNAPPLSGSLGVLDADGRGAAGFSLPPGSNPAWAGTTLHHAFLTVGLGAGGAPLLTSTSNAVPLALVP